MATIAFLGLGVMGFPMAGHLARQGHSVTVYNRTQSKAEHWVATYGGTSQPTPALAVAGSDLVCVCVGNDQDLASVLLGEAGALAAMEPGSLLLDHTTASADMARQLGQTAQSLGIGFVDAPVSGGQAGAEQGQLVIMCGGDADDVDKAQIAMSAYAANITHMGAVGCGQLTKMVNQICIAGLVQGLSEGVAFALNAGLDAKQVFSAIAGGAAGSWQMANRHGSMIDDQFDFGFAVNWMRKDLAICLEEASRNGSALPVTKLVDSYYQEVQAMGGQTWDTSSLIKRLPRPSTIQSNSDD